jgi:hypothetical protein
MSTDDTNEGRPNKPEKPKDKKEKDARDEQTPSGLPDLEQRLLMIYERAIERAGDTDTKT